MQAQRGDAHVVYGPCLLQLGQNQADSIGMLRLNSCFVASKEELLQSFVRKALDHWGIVTQYFPESNLMGYAASALLRTA